jgi:thioredoxin reductase
MKSSSQDSNITVLGAGPYGLSSATYLRAAGVETRVFGEPMTFWENQMPAGMFLRSGWTASHIADPTGKLTLDTYRSISGNHWAWPVPLQRFVDYGLWFQKQVVPDVDRRAIEKIDSNGKGFKVTLADGETFNSRRVVIAAGIGTFASRPVEFDGIPSSLATHSAGRQDLKRFKGQSVVVIGAGQSALESAALLHEGGAHVEVIARQSVLNWVGAHRWIHELGPISKLLYSPRDVGPAGLSRIVTVPRLFKMFPRWFQTRASYRSIRPAGSFWLRPRLLNVPITLGRSVTTAAATTSKLKLKLDDGSERLVDHALLATGFKVDISRYKFLSDALKVRLETFNGYPILTRGLESSIPGLHFMGRPAAWSFGPLLCFVSGTEFASKDLISVVARKQA